MGVPTFTTHHKQHCALCTMRYILHIEFGGASAPQAPTCLRPCVFHFFKMKKEKKGMKYLSPVPSPNPNCNTKHV